MKRGILKTKKYLKSKKGFSLLELLCAVMIMAIAVSATATGLAISYQSITKNSLMDQASAKAQMYCDVIMTYVEKTPSNDPDSSKPWTSIPGLKISENKLFAGQASFSFTDDIKDKIEHDVTNLDSSMTKSTQYNTKADAESKAFDKTEVAYLIEKHGYYQNSAGVDMVSYKITVYINYGTNGTTTCTGIVTKNKYIF